MADSFVRACLITNPKSGRGGVDLSDALTVLQANGWDVTVRQKLKGGMAEDLAREAVKQGYNVVVDCGGDGTLSEIVNGVVGADIAVGTLPGGTANVWAHEMGISTQLRRAAMQLVTATRRRVDVGHVDVNGKHGAYFLMMAGIGVDALELTAHEFACGHGNAILSGRRATLALIKLTLGITSPMPWSASYGVAPTRL